MSFPGIRCGKCGEPYELGRAHRCDLAVGEMIEIELIGGPYDGTRLWYAGRVPRLVEYTTQDAVGPMGDESIEHKTTVRVHRYYRTGVRTMLYWPPGRKPPGRYERELA